MMNGHFTPSSGYLYFRIIAYPVKPKETFTHFFYQAFCSLVSHDSQNWTIRTFLPLLRVAFQISPTTHVPSHQRNFEYDAKDRGSGWQLIPACLPCYLYQGSNPSHPQGSGNVASSSAPFPTWQNLRKSLSPPRWNVERSEWKNKTLRNSRYSHNPRLRDIWLTQNTW